jgi:general secretion pathway protein A
MTIEQFYGLATRPFQLNPDPAFYFSSKQHAKAKTYLEYGLSLGEGFVVITGDIGAGKTTILRGLLEQWDTSMLVVGQLVTTQLSADDVLKLVAAAFGVEATDQSKSQTLLRLEGFLTYQASQGKRCLLLVDEAQNLAPSVVEELRMLSNFQLGTQSLLQTFLIGQPELRDTMQRPEMEQLRQRVIATCHLGPMDLEDTSLYIEHRLRQAGSTGHPTFTPAAYVAIQAATQGLPRRINTVCDRVLLHGFLGERMVLDAADVQSVADELAQDAGYQLSPSGGATESTPTSATSTPRAKRLVEIERSLLRLERQGLESLELQRALLDALLQQQTKGKP